MNIIVCIKQVPDTEIKVKINSSLNGILEDDLNFVMNPYDEFSVEEAVRIKEKNEGTTVTLLTVGPERVTQTLRTGLAIGADNAIHVVTDEVKDPLVTAKILASIIKTLPHDLIFCGKQAVDDDTSLVGSALAAILDLPQISVIRKIDIQGNKVTCEKEVEGAAEIIEAPLPVVVTSQLGLNEPRYPSLPNIMKAKKKEIKTMTLAETGVENKTYVIVDSLAYPPARAAGKKVPGDEALELANNLAGLLRSEARVI